MSNLPAVVKPQLPESLPKEYALQYGKQAGAYAQDAGDVTIADIGLSFIKLIHGMSKEAKPGWDGPESKALAPGTMLLSRQKKILPVGTIFVPLLRSTRYIKWEGRPGDGRMIDVCESANDPKIQRDNGLAWIRDEAGDLVPPSWTKYVNFWCITPHNPQEPAILSFYRTSLPVAKRLTSELLRLTNVWSLPLFLFKFEFRTPRWAQKGNNSWPQIEFAYQGPVKQEGLTKTENAYKIAQALFQATSKEAQISKENTDDAPTVVNEFKDAEPDAAPQHAEVVAVESPAPQTIPEQTQVTPIPEVADLW